MSDVVADGTIVIVKNVRLATFPDLFVPKQFEGAGDFKYKAGFVIEAGSENKTAVDAAIQAAAVGKWGAKAPAVLKGCEGQKKEFCFIDGARLDRPEYEGMWVLSSVRRQKDGAPKVIDQRKEVLTVQDGKPYPGCYVNAKVQLWAQDNAFGKAIRCTLMTVQFAKDGEAFSGAGPATDAGFDEIADDANDLL